MNIDSAARNRALTSGDRTNEPLTAVFVRFHYQEAFDDAKLTRIAVQARSKFEGLRHLRFKLFTFNRDSGEAVNVYLWDNEGAARAFFSDALLDSVAAIYGTRPTVQFARVPSFVDNPVG